jgi:hypothetical protein
MNLEAPTITLKVVDDLEREKLVAELLARNQQLRQALDSANRPHGH